jgi:hypothetical protein
VQHGGPAIPAVITHGHPQADREGQWQGSVGAGKQKDWGHWLEAEGPRTREGGWWPAVVKHMVSPKLLDHQPYNNGVLGLRPGHVSKQVT